MLILLRLVNTGHWTVSVCIRSGYSMDYIAFIYSFYALQDIVLWQETALFQTLSAIGPCKRAVIILSQCTNLIITDLPCTHFYLCAPSDGSFPISAQRAFVGMLSDVTDTFSVSIAATVGYFNMYYSLTCIFIICIL